MKITIPILCSSRYDLNKFDFSFKDITIYDITSKEFSDYIEEQQPDLFEQNFNYFDSIIKNIHFDYDKRYAIVKNNPKLNFNHLDVINVWKILLIIFPSDLQIEHEVNFKFEDNFFQRTSMATWNRRSTGEYPGEFLNSLDEDLEEINEYIKTVFDKLNLENYIGLTIENYITSYSASHFHFQYLTLCIALESIIYGNQELTYRLKRNVSIICGEDEFNCNIIFENLNKLYNLRSKIIHGETYDLKKVLEYLKPIKSIVSRTIIELLIHDFEKKDLLNHRLTEIGFGDRKKISKAWKYYKLNVLTMVDTNWITLN